MITPAREARAGDPDRRRALVYGPRDDESLILKNNAQHTVLPLCIFKDE